MYSGDEEERGVVGMKKMGENGRKEEFVLMGSLELRLAAIIGEKFVLSKIVGSRLISKPKLKI